ncbi:Signal recognition particle protein [Posidoniimonas polymericola]|uniref:Signal recognition particle protein n=1 Tax=Posidoniimonas polymericola TaxID=2528002 RepID=A0A5C5YTE9_9BACT|nr:signal recognition particle protein [Posidoniimonas polymericola]TWT78081.1 Signal recognition particle protein [Posidoniimonas polymericola]
MFENLQDGLSSALKSLSGKGKLSESNMRDGLKLVERSLLEADVSYEVVRTFMKNVTEVAVGEKVLKSLNPSQQIVGTVHQELINLMGPVDHSLHLKGPGEVTVLMMCGLQGSGKTTSCGKLGRMLKQRGRKPLLVAADLQRPAAIDQLHVLGEQLDIPVYSERGEQDPVKVCNNAVKQAKKLGADTVILDTAGRLHIDDELMGQLERIDKQCNPEQIYLVCDGMTGQDAVNSAQAFNQALEIDGVIMTKLDGDARGGAALSVKQVTGVPIKFIGTGEHLDALEEFHPDRMAGRILGQGDILSLVEKAQAEFDEDEMKAQEERLAKGEFTLDDFKKQLKQITRLGPLRKVMGMIPGMGGMLDSLGDVDPENDMKQLFGIIDSMTPAEKRDPKLIDQSRRRRIAAGSGVEPHQVNELVKMFEPMSQMMKAMAGKGMKDRMKMFNQIKGDMMQNPAGALTRKKQGTGKRLSAKDKATAKKEREKMLKKLRKQKKKR